MVPAFGQLQLRIPRAKQRRWRWPLTKLPCKTWLKSQSQNDRLVWLTLAEDTPTAPIHPSRIRQRDDSARVDYRPVDLLSASPSSFQIAQCCHPCGRGNRWQKDRPDHDQYEPLQQWRSGLFLSNS